MNPNNLPEVCECGHEESDHELEDVTSYMYDPPLMMCKFCFCDEWIPRDDQFYADREFDAKAEKWERDRK